MSSHDIRADILQQTSIIFQLFSSHYADILQPFTFFLVLKCLDYSSDFQTFLFSICRHFADFLQTKSRHFFFANSMKNREVMFQTFCSHCRHFADITLDDVSWQDIFKTFCSKSPDIFVNSFLTRDLIGLRQKSRIQLC